MHCGVVRIASVAKLTKLPGCRGRWPLRISLPSSLKIIREADRRPSRQRPPASPADSARGVGAGARDFPTLAEAAILSAVFLIVGGGAGKFAMRDVRELGEVTRAQIQDYRIYISRLG